MVRIVLGVITIVLLLLPASLVLAAEGQVLKVVNGDTFRVEVNGSKGPETVEVNLRCSDAPILSSIFGKESKEYLETLLHKSGSVNFRIQAYCGSESCVEVFAFIPSLSNSDINYINTQMIAAGMARNDSCRGVFKEAEDQAKAAKRGIWSTTKKIVFAEPKQVAVSSGAAKSVKIPVITNQKSNAAATIEVDRADRTVTLKSREMSLNRAIRAIDSVSTMPVNLYQFEDQIFPLNMEKVPWYRALQLIVKTANLKQVNMNGKIDLYDQFFYYKHIAPYMKLSDNDGSSIKVSSGAKEVSAADDGVTRYVFVNDFENSAAAARAKEEGQSGFVQVHKGASQAPLSNDGRFEVSKGKVTPAVVAQQKPVEATTAPAAIPIVAPPIVAPPVVAPPVVAPPVAAVRSDDESVATVKIESGATKGDIEDSSAQIEGKSTEAVPISPAGNVTVEPTAKGSDSAPVLNIQLDYVQLGVLLVVVLVVVFGSIFLSRSAARRASKAEKSVDAASLGQQNPAAVADSEPQVDKAYEQEIFADIVTDDSAAETEKAVDEIFRNDTSSPVEQAVTIQESGELKAVVVEPTVTEVEPTVTEKEPTVTEKEPTVTEKEPTVTEKEPTKPEKAKKAQSNSVKKAESDGGNFAVTLDDYDRLMNPPKREPRMDCLFEVVCRLEGQTVTGIGLDINSGGIFIDSKEKFGVGKVLELEFRLREEDPAPIFCRGAVTWINERPDPIKVNYPNGFGVCFIDIEAATESLITGFLKMSVVKSELDS